MENRVPSAPIALLTDYGWADPYVAALKAVILSISPTVTIFDITHDIAPQAVEHGAFTLAQIAPFLPSATICVAVVDPGVGTDRKSIAMQTADMTFVGPDNGLASGLMEDAERSQVRGASASAIGIPAGSRAVELRNSAYFHLPVSSTFHGRDIFAPVAAHLSTGIPLDELGPPIDGILAFAPWRAVRQSDSSFIGRVISIDRFGNLITDARVDDLPHEAAREQFETRIGHTTLRGLQRTFQDGPDLVVYAGSSGFIEIARRNGSAAHALKAALGDAVCIRLDPEGPP